MTARFPYVLRLAVVLLSLAFLGAGPPALLNVPFDAQAAAGARAAWAQAGVPAEFTNSLGARLVLIPPGRFTLGANGHTQRVTLNKPFYLGVTEVTLGEYRKFRPDHRIDKAANEFNDNSRPAAMVSWEDARAFCRWLSDQPQEKAAGRIYALPTDAQWEWAARAGSAQPRAFGDGKTDQGLTDHAWFNHTYTPNPMHEVDGRGRQPVGKLQANAWGLHDMFGNVWEWCDDRRIDPATGEERQPIMRGGSWRSGGSHCTVTAHDPGHPQAKADNIGLRLSCVVATKE